MSCSYFGREYHVDAQIGCIIVHVAPYLVVERMITGISWRSGVAALIALRPLLLVGQGACSSALALSGLFLVFYSEAPDQV